jgi:hypothetical protein
MVITRPESGNPRPTCSVVREQVCALVSMRSGAPPVVAIAEGRLKLAGLLAAETGDQIRFSALPPEDVSLHEEYDALLISLWPDDPAQRPDPDQLTDYLAVVPLVMVVDFEDLPQNRTLTRSRDWNWQKMQRRRRMRRWMKLLQRRGMSTRWEPTQSAGGAVIARAQEIQPC